MMDDLRELRILYFLPLAIRMGRRYGFGDEDMTQEALVALVQAVDAFNPADPRFASKPMWAFVSGFIRHRLLEARRQWMFQHGWIRAYRPGQTPEMRQLVVFVSLEENLCHH